MCIYLSKHSLVDMFILGYCMEPMAGEQDLEENRIKVTDDAEGQSTNINEDNPWTFALMQEPLQNRERNPKLIVTFKRKVEVHGLKLQGNTDEVNDIILLLSVKDESADMFSDVTESPDKILVSKAT